jgi:hypothetical protein
MNNQWPSCEMWQNENKSSMKAKAAAAQRICCGGKKKWLSGSNSNQ